MSLSNCVAKMRFAYHANMVELVNVANQLHFMSDEKAEEANKNHVMTIITDILPRLGYDVEGYMKQQKEKES